MTTVRELATKLASYANAAQGNGKVEIMLAYDADVAYPLLRADENSAMGGSGAVEWFLVLVPDVKGKRLLLKGRD